MRARIENEKLENVEVVAADARNPFHGHKLGEGPPLQGSVDVAIMCDVYHHLEYPRTACKHIRRYLTPDTGRLVIVDFHRDPARVKSHTEEWVLRHLRADQATFRQEVLTSGYRLVEEVEVPGLEENYVMIFASADADLANPGESWTGRG
mmetsp:Transcript_20098/g.58780  ORF Transcript_20098/g.58780 Transcript_20098/m.58780 type:complete len:150 (+) Transcript_20098:651-1100(+)